jgi:hypothetical protein
MFLMLPLRAVLKLGQGDKGTTLVRRDFEVDWERSWLWDLYELATPDYSGTGLEQVGG